MFSPTYLDTAELFPGFQDRHFQPHDPCADLTAAPLIPRNATIDVTELKIPAAEFLVNERTSGWKYLDVNKLDTMVLNYFFYFFIHSRYLGLTLVNPEALREIKPHF
jgi:hypothetical protein